MSPRIGCFGLCQCGQLPIRRVKLVALTAAPSWVPRSFGFKVSGPADVKERKRVRDA